MLHLDMKPKNVMRDEDGLDDEKTELDKPKPTSEQERETKPTPKSVHKPFPKWLYGLFAGGAVAILAAATAGTGYPSGLCSVRICPPHGQKTKFETSSPT